MKRWIFSIGILVAVAALNACSQSSPPPAPRPATAPLPPRVVGGLINAQGDGIPDVPVTICMADGRNITTRTNADGSFSADVPPGQMQWVLVESGRVHKFRRWVLAEAGRTHHVGFLDLTVTTLAEKLSDDSRAVRKEALYSLYKEPTLDETFVAPLMHMLADSDPDLARRAAGFLKEIGDPASTEALLKVYRTASDKTVRRDACEGLIKIEGRAFAGELRALLNSSDQDERRTALHTLRDLYLPEMLDPVMGRLTEPDPDLRARACMILASYANPVAVEPLCRIAADDPDPGVRRMAAYALGRIGDPRALDTLEALLAANNYPAGGSSKLAPRVPDELTPQAEAKLYQHEARAQALIALRVIGGTKAADALYKATQPPHASELRGDAMVLLAEMNDPRVAGLALKHLTSRDLFLWSSAVLASRYVTDPQLLPALVKAIEGPRPYSTRYVRHSLGGTTSGGSIRSDHCCALGMLILKERWPAEAPVVLVKRLADPEVAGRAAELLADLGHRAAVPQLITLLEESQHPYTKSDVGRALCRLQVNAAFDRCLNLVDAYDDRLPEVMGPLAEAGFLDQLTAELQHGRKLAAARVAAYVHKPQLVDVLVPLLQHSDPEVRRAAMAALGAQRSSRSTAVLTKLLRANLKEQIQSRHTTKRPSEIRWQNERITYTLTQALGDARDPAAAEILLLALHENGRPSHIAVQMSSALAKTGNPAAFDPLVKLVRRHPEAAAALGLLGDPRALPHLRQAAALGTSSLVAGKAIAVFDPTASIAAFDLTLRTYTDDYGRAHKQAIAELVKIGSPAVVPSLRYALTDDDAEVRAAARAALAQLKVPAP